jgi:hypothetical protein
VEAVGLLAGTGWAAGVNVYAVVVLLGLLGRAGVDQVPDVLLRADVLVLAGGLYLIEFVVDKVPWLDSVWDVVHTVVRPAGAAILGGLLAGEFADVSQAAAAIGSGAVAFASHGVKASARAAINTSPEPVSNGVVSLAEDGLVAGVVLLAVANPVAALVVVVVLLVGGVVTVALLVRTLRRAWRRWRARRSGGTTGGTSDSPGGTTGGP